MEVVWDLKKATVNIRTHSIFRMTLCAVLYATIYVERRVYEEKE